MSATAGAFAGLAYEAIAYYKEEYYPVKHLDPPPEAFFVDGAAFHLYARFTRYKPYNVVSYIASQQNADALLKLEHTLSSWAPKSRDLRRAELYHKTALHHAHLLCKSYQQQTKEADLESKDLLACLEHFLDSHLQNITELCI